MKLISRIKRSVASRVRKAWRRLKSLRKSHSPPRFPITELDEWSMLQIFDRLPPRDLIRVRHVCRGWNELSRRACHGRRSLTLMMRPDKKKTNGDSVFPDINMPNDTLVTFQLNHAIVEYLSSTFNNITRLEVILISPKQFGQVQHLLEHWGPQLRALQITSKARDNEKLPEDMQTNVKILFGRINSLPSLTHLAVDFEFFIFDEDAPGGAICLSILGKLQLFWFRTFDPFSMILDSAVQYAAPNGNQIGRAHV